VSRGDSAAVSAITAQGLWVAGAIGATMTLLLWNFCPAIFVSMGASPEVIASAVPYLRGRCIASPAIMAFYVLSGTFRGFKDTRRAAVVCPAVPGPALACPALLALALPCPGWAGAPFPRVSCPFPSSARPQVKASYTRAEGGASRREAPQRRTPLIAGLASNVTHRSRRVPPRRTPLIAGLASNVIHLFLDVALVFWAGMGVAGAALATSISHWATFAFLLSMVVGKGHLR
jgi:hypothetical protein